MLLLLLWRHLEYYSDDSNAHNPNVSSATSHAMRFLATPDPEVFREEVGKRLGPTLQRLESLELVRLALVCFQLDGQLTIHCFQDSDALGDDWQASERYLEIMCRRLEDSAGLSDGKSTQDDS